MGLLEERYSLLPPERLTPEQLEIWTERKQKLIRLRLERKKKKKIGNIFQTCDKLTLFLCE